jgi:putative ABC transport system permease protein
VALRLHSVVRDLLRAPAFTALVVATLALGIGATTAMFSVVDAVLLNPLPFPNADRLGETWTVSQTGTRRPGANTAVLTELRRHTDLFTAVEGYQFGTVNLTGSGEPEIVPTSSLTPGMLALLGIQPALGRWFTEDDAIAGNVVLISHGIWVRRFGADTGIVGKTVMLDDQPHRVVGVMPARMRFPEASASMWRPLNVAAASKPVYSQAISLRRPELSRDQVNDRLAAMTAAWRDGGLIRPTESITTDALLQERFGQQSGQTLYVMFGAVLLVMLVACVNVMNLLLVRAAARAGELALRSALGASVGSLLRMIVIESVLLAAAGCAAGILLGHGLLALILRAAPQQLTFLTGSASAIDGRALFFAVVLAITTCLVFGVLPAWRVMHTDAIDTLKRRAHAVAGARDDRWQGALVTAQLALVLVLLAGAGLLLRSFDRLIRVDPGFAVDELAVVELQLPAHRYGAPGAGLAFMQQLERAVEDTGLRATIAGGAPPRGGGVTFNVVAEIDDGRTLALGSERVWSTGVAPDYFTLMGIRVIEGRNFDSGDDPSSVIVGSVMASRFFGDTPTLGRRFRLAPSHPWMTVVGVAADVKQLGPNEPRDDGMEFYRPFAATTLNAYFVLIVRAPAEHGAALQTVKEKLWQIDPKQPIITASTMPDRIGESIARPRFYLMLASAFAVAGVLLAMIGVYGVSAYWVARRRRELAIRLAVGATKRNVIALIVRRSLALAAIGGGIGLALTVAGTRFVESMLFEVSAYDPATLIATAGVLAAVVVAGCIGPALQAARVDPMTTLRAE